MGHPLPQSGEFGEKRSWSAEPRPHFQSSRPPRPTESTSKALGSSPNAWSFLLIRLSRTVQNLLDGLLQRRRFWVQAHLPLVLQGGYDFHPRALGAGGDHLHFSDHPGMDARGGAQAHAAQLPHDGSHGTRAAQGPRRRQQQQQEQRAEPARQAGDAGGAGPVASIVL